MKKTGKTVVMGVCGGIAAYKAAGIARALYKRNVDTWVVMTQNATAFVTPLTFETLTGNPVAVDMFAEKKNWHVEHIALAQRADVFLVAPATANVIGKLANGIADDMLTTTIMATKAPIILAPAMNRGMLENPAYQRNEQVLRQWGVQFISPQYGQLANGQIGDGRLADPDRIIEDVMLLLDSRKDLIGKRIMITAGPTREPIDPVRFISNRSSGKMGYALAAQASQRGADVTLITGPVALERPMHVQTIPVETTEQMMNALLERIDDVDIIIKAAAPADFKPKTPYNQKLKDHELSLDLIANPDIAYAIGQRKVNQVLVIFAAETQQLLENAEKKLKKKNADLCVANDVSLPDAGFDADTNIATFIWQDGRTKPYPCMDKSELADVILDEALALWEARL